jgi:hypothetical protein
MSQSLQEKKDDASLLKGTKFLCEECGSEGVRKIKGQRFCSTEHRQAFRGRLRWETRKEEMKARHKKWATENFQKRREYNLKRTFGITIEQYEDLLDKQGRCCYICKRPETDFAKKMAVDHDHVTGEIRGILCHPCNKMLIGKHRDPKIFLRAFDYLNRDFTGWIVPKKKKRKKKSRAKHS